ncbi:MAG TPA: hypothetical protein VME20_09170 [Acidimicrobiales bacterium]|nr:hypothetical protein [Acidimicrobiales bacterium]
MAKLPSAISGATASGAVALACDFVPTLGRRLQRDPDRVARAGEED